MKHPSLLCLSLAALAGAATLSPVLAQAPEPPVVQQNTTDWKQGGWGHLSPTIGTYDYDLILKEEGVDDALTGLMGDKKQKLLENLFVRGPIGFDRDCLVLTGNAEKSGGFDMAYVNVCVYALTINVALMEEGNITIYSDTDTYEYLPDGLRQWVYGAMNRDAYRALPPKVKMVKRGG